MKKIIVLVPILMVAFGLFGCSEVQGKSIVSTQENASVSQTESVNVNEAETKELADELTVDEPIKEKDTYYIMSYTNDVNVEDVMHAILGDGAEFKEFEKVKMEEVANEYNGLTSYRGSMTVDGRNYRWEKCEGGFSYSVGYLDVAVDLDVAEEIVKDFLKRLGWEYGDEIQLEKCADGTVDVECRLFYDDVKLMGEHTFYFEPENEHEVGASGFFINMAINGNGIMSLVLSAVPQVTEVLRAYDLDEDLLDPEEIEQIVDEYFKIQENVLERMDLTLDEMQMDVELIYMPYKDISSGGDQVLMPAYEIRIPSGPGVRAKTMVLYVDAISGYVYDRNYEF